MIRSKPIPLKFEIIKNSTLASNCIMVCVKLDPIFLTALNHWRRFVGVAKRIKAQIFDSPVDYQVSLRYDNCALEILLVID